MYAVRNIRLCTKDCLCLYVCPTGATDTDNGQIDAAKCLDGCRACVDSCPSGAISLVPRNFPPQQVKKREVTQPLQTLLNKKAREEQAADAMLKDAKTPEERQLAQALKQSIRVVMEDLSRESGYMLPQGKGARAFLKTMLDEEQPEGFPLQAVKRLLELLGE